VKNSPALAFHSINCDDKGAGVTHSHQRSFKKLSLRIKPTTQAAVPENYEFLVLQMARVELFADLNTASGPRLIQRITKPDCAPAKPGNYITSGGYRHFDLSAMNGT
jgi:hypothetical protein